MIVNDDDENKEEELLPDRATANGEIFGKLQERVKQRLQVLEYKMIKHKIQITRPVFSENFITRILLLGVQIVARVQILNSLVFWRPTLDFSWYSKNFRMERKFSSKRKFYRERKLYSEKNLFKYRSPQDLPGALGETELRRKEVWGGTI